MDLTSQILKTTPEKTDFVDKLVGHTKIYKRMVPLLPIKGKAIEVDVFQRVKKDVEDGFYYLSLKGKTLGAVQLHNDLDSIFISEIHARARRWFKGIGFRLIQIAEEESRINHHYGEMKLSAHRQELFQRNPNKFYERLGFVNYVEMSDEKNATGTAKVLCGSHARSWDVIIRTQPILTESIPDIYSKQ